MMKKILAFVLLFALCSAANASDVINDFAFNAARLMGENYFFSPYSIISAFGMAYAGASGDTKIEIDNALGLSSDFHAKTFEGVNSANRVWLREGLTLKKDYAEKLSRDYESTAAELDFLHDTKESRKIINEWVSDNTNGKIKNLIRQLEPDTQMILTNAIYFNAQWLSKFDKEDTTTEKFYSGEKVSEVPMMKQNNNFMYAEHDGTKIIRLPYEGRNLSMIIILPAKNKTLEMNSEKFSSWLHSMKRYEVDLWLPKFKSEKRYELKNIFEKLGVKKAFSNGADFSGITADENLKIDEIIHQTFIDVDEEKTEAAAATAVIMVRATAMFEQKPRAEFHANRPFTYFIIDNKTETILFMGSQAF